jgi:sarcosine oxidase subunit gamma
LPQIVGSVTIAEVRYQTITSVAPFKGQQKTVSAALKDALGFGLPAVGRTVGKSDVRLMWAGQGLTFVMNAPVPDLARLAAVTDQSDGWAAVSISGAGVEDVLARLMPLDLRSATFKTGHTARTMVAHMTASVTRTSAQTFELMVMRSMVVTLMHDLDDAAKAVATRAYVASA